METLQISLAAARVNAGMTQDEVAKKCMYLKIRLSIGKKERQNLQFHSAES